MSLNVMFSVMATPTAKSLILDLLSTLRGGAMPVRALVEAARLFAIEENNLRVSLARLCAAGVLERDERGLYRIGAPAAAVERQVTSWRRIEDRVCEWSGGWVAAQGGHSGSSRSSGSPRGAAGRRSAQALRFLGFRALEGSLMLRPDNLKGGVAQVRDKLLTLGLVEGVAVFGVRDLDAEREEKARGLWDTDALLARYARHSAEIAASQKRLSSLPPEQAMVESFLLGGGVLRQLVLDPLLPEPILPAAPRRELLLAMRDYDRVGRAAWADFLRGHGVVHLQAPADLRLGETQRLFSANDTGASA